MKKVLTFIQGAALILLAQKFAWLAYYSPDGLHGNDSVPAIFYGMMTMLCAFGGVALFVMSVVGDISDNK